MNATAHPELSRDYFEREARKGRRVIFLWHVSKRWPEYENALRDEWIEGMEFTDSAAAQHFAVAGCMTSAELFATWEEAEAWLRTAPHEQENEP